MYNVAVFSNHKDINNKIKDICEKLEDEIFICYEGQSKSDFLEKIKNGLKVDIVISEEYLDHSRIYNLLKKTNEYNPNVKSIAIVSKINLKECQELLECGTNYILGRDFTLEELEKSLIHVCKVIKMQNNFVDKINALQKRDSKVSYSIVSSLLNILMTNHSVSPEFGKRLKYENINYDKRYCILALIDYLPEESSITAFEGEEILLEVISTFKKINDENLEMHWFDRSNTFVLLLLSDKKIDKNFLINNFSSIFKKREEKGIDTKIKISVSDISDVAEGRSFRKLYRHAKRCLQYRQIEKAPNIIFYEDIKQFEQNEGRVDEREYSGLSSDLANGNIISLKKKIVSLVHRSFLPKFQKSFEYMISSIVLAIYRGCPYITKEADSISIKDVIRKSVSINNEKDLETFLFNFSDKMDHINKKWRKKGVAVSYESIYNYLKDHFQDASFNINSLCKHFNYSKTYLFEILKKHKTSYVKLINNLRISYACDLLLNTNKNVKTIASQSGFSSLNVFSNKFKQEKKMSPMQFKKKYK